MTMQRPAALAAAAAGIAAMLAGGLALSAQPALAAADGSDCVGRQTFGKGTWLNVVAEGMRNSTGKLVVTIYPDKRSQFLASNGELNVGRVDAQSGETRLCVFIPATGVYSLAAYHDEDSDGNFDRNPLPTEGYGFSNDPPTLFSLPSFKSTRVSVPRNNMTVRIRMHYRN